MISSVCKILCFIIYPSSIANPVVQLPTGGTVIGRATQHSFEFLGIPYAKPKLRWSPPHDMNEPASNPFDATTFGPCCTQSDAFGLFIPSQDEDCLNLNIFTPNKMPDIDAPVMVWIHGGGGTSGCSAQSLPPLYNGTNLLNKASHVGQVVVVTINYRLSALGTLYLSELVQETSLRNSANFFLQDVLSALRWIQRSISVFGGDPKRVLLFGQSAGGNIALAIPTVSGAEGLLNGVISESSTASIATGWVNVTEANSLGRNFASILGCNMTGSELLVCLRAIEAKDIVNKLGFTQLGSVVDGVVVPTYPYWAYQQGISAKLTTAVLGWNQPDNFPLCVENPHADATLASLYLSQQIPLWTGAPTTMIPAILQTYNISTCKPGGHGIVETDTCCWLAALALREAVFTCNGWRLLNAMNKHTPGRQFWYDLSCFPKCPDPGPNLRNICQHTSELAYVFGTESNYVSSKVPLCHWDEQTESFSSNVIANWVSIATNANPYNVSQWSPFDGKDIFLISPIHPFETKPWEGSARCKLWKSIDATLAAEKFSHIKKN